MSVLSPTLTVMIAAVRKAARGIMRDFGELELLQVSRKGTADFVTTTDTRVEKILMQELKKARPGYGFLMEEAGVVEGADASMRWIIDPLDGTTNFIHALPHVCIAVALEKVISPTKREIVAGVIFDPLRDELFHAEKGAGAYLNNRRLQVAGRKDITETLLGTGLPRYSYEGYSAALAMLNRVMESGTGIRCMGAAALDLAYVAAGRTDGYWHAALHAWDMAAGMLIVREAGGDVTDISGGQSMLEHGGIVASNPQLQQKIRALVAPVVK